ncbi:MAG: phosphoribosylformylglycinamidine synthase [Chitinophagaceae bacterium]|nr:phosphoribosylformylglycinamidine synthase [Chitinophagaceae bacterium]
MVAAFLFLFLFSTITFQVQAQTISPKRGVAGDLLNNADCLAADTLSWFYNWANTPNASVINTHQNYLEFCPMLWNGTWNPTALNNYLNGHPEVKYLLTFNEPNYSVQSNMTPAQAAALWPQVEAIATAHNLKIVSPAMSYCNGTCISGYNNMSGSVWLDDFFTACPGCRVDHIAIHIYDTWYYGFQGVLNAYRKYNRPMWVTEFDYGGSNSVTQQAALMVDVLDFMEKDPDIFRYAWFLVRSSPSATSTDIFSQTTGSLSALGTIYEHMSSYDKTYFHNVNARIEAEYYISKSVTYCDWNGSACNWPYSIQLEPTTDLDGRLDAYNFASPVANSNDTIFYNVDIPTTQTYTMDFRVNSTAASTIAVRTYPGNALLGTTASLNTGGAWQTKTLTGVNLTAGQQKIYLTAANGTPLKLNWLRINCSSNCGTLPVELEYFNASDVSEHTASLNWKTASEKNNAAFIVEKSTDGISFNTIGSVLSEGTSSNVPKTYSFIDSDVFGSTTYYRLKQVDTDGAFTYSPVRLITHTPHSIIITSNAFVTELSEAQTIFYSVTTTSGQVVQQGSYQANAGIFEKTMDLKGLASGVYIVQVISNEMTSSAKIVKE